MRRSLPGRTRLRGTVNASFHKVKRLFFYRWKAFVGTPDTVLRRMIVSVHIADMRPREMAAAPLPPPRRGRIPGLPNAETTRTAALGEPLLPPRRFGRIGMIAAWESDAALDDFLRLHPAPHPLARR